MINKADWQGRRRTLLEYVEESDKPRMMPAAFFIILASHQMECDQDHVDQFDADKRHHDATQAVNQEVTP